MVVYFDGTCAFCDASVHLLMKLDRDRKLQFAPLQGVTAFENLPITDTRNLDALIVVKNGGIFRASDAVIQILLELRGWRFVGSLLTCIPRSLREWAYRMIARFRYRIWGRLASCRIPTPEERLRFLP